MITWDQNFNLTLGNILRSWFKKKKKQNINHQLGATNKGIPIPKELVRIFFYNKKIILLFGRIIYLLEHNKYMCWLLA